MYQGVQSFSALQFPSDVVPEFYPYVLIGTGPAVLAAAAKIREDEGDDKKVFISYFFIGFLLIILILVVYLDSYCW